MNAYTSPGRCRVTSGLMAVESGLRYCPDHFQRVLALRDWLWWKTKEAKHVGI
jgi:hypothetical protein